MWCLESYSPVQPAKDVSRTNSRQIPDSGICLEFDFKSQKMNRIQIPDKSQSLGFVWEILGNLGSGISQTFPDKSQTLEFVWNVSGICLGCVWNVVGICRLEVVWDLSDICLESLILVPRGTPGIVRDSNDREVLTE